MKYSIVVFENVTIYVALILLLRLLRCYSNVIDVGVHAHSSFLLISVCPTVRGRIDSFLRRSPLALFSSVYQGSSQFSRVYGERFALSLTCAHQVGQVGERESNIADRYAVVKVHTSSGEG